MGFNLPERPDDSHKGTFGKVLNVAGSDYMPGAAYLSSIAALKVGCGYCFLASTQKAIDIVASQTQNVVFLPFEEIKNQEPDVISIGCGLTTSKEAEKVFIETLNTFHDVPTIIDADGINILSKLQIETPKNLILTPHRLEASRILGGVPLETIKEDPAYYAMEISKKYNCIAVMKGHPTVVAIPEPGFYINDTGNSELAKAGSGDVLTGMLAGFIAQGMDMFEAAKLAVHLHGLCGELASKKLTKYSVMASDLISFIPNAISSCLPENSCD